MERIITVGLDFSKHVFQVHGADRNGAVIVRKKLRREQLLAFLRGAAPLHLRHGSMRGAHHWAREIERLGHEVKLIAPAYVKPFVKRQKNDMADAEAICEAAQRPTMRFLPVKSEGAQASALVFRTRDLLVRQRTQLINALRGHMTEFGIIVAQGPMHVAKLIAVIEDPGSGIPEPARVVLDVLVAELKALDEQVLTLDAEIMRRAKDDPVARRFMTIPRIGAITATALVALAPSSANFRRGARLRHLAGAHSSTAIERRQGAAGADLQDGERTLRRLLIIGASAVAGWASRKGPTPGTWLASILSRKPPMLVRVALANKMARMVWALLAHGGVYRAPALAA